MTASQGRTQAHGEPRELEKESKDLEINNEKVLGRSIQKVESIPRDMIPMSSLNHNQEASRQAQEVQHYGDIIDRQRMEGLQEFPIIVITDFEKELSKVPINHTAPQQGFLHTISQQEEQPGIEGLINVPNELPESSTIFKDRTSNALLSWGTAIMNSDKSSRKKWTRRT